MKKLCTVFILLLITSLFGQNISEQEEVVRVESRLVVVPVSVLDQNGNPISGLSLSDFTLKEENKPQRINALLQSEESQLEIAILFDISATTEPIYELQREALVHFLQNVARPEDRVSIFLIGTRPVLFQERNSAIEAIKAVSRLLPSKQYTALYDTIAEASNYLKKNASTNSRKVILAITDGEDTNSEKIASASQQGYQQIGAKIDTLDSKSLYEITTKIRDEASRKEEERVLRILQRADVVFYSINLSAGAFHLNKISQKGQKTLEKMAEETGGTAYFFGFLPTNLKNYYQNQVNERLNKEAIASVFQKLAGELRRQYLLQYYSETEFPEGKFVKLSVEVNRTGNFKVKARQGYFVEKR